MCLLSSTLFISVVMGMTGLQPAASHDAISSWLERHGLVRQLAIHLEDQLPSLPASERPAFLLRLAELYGLLLESETDAQSRDELERRGRALLKKIGPNTTSSLTLRLALARGAYRGAERLSERWRFRAVVDQDESSIRDLFEDVITDLSMLGNEISRELSTAKRRLENSSRSAAAVEVDRVRQLGSLRTEVQFLLGWSKYYAAWLGGPSQRLPEARAIFWSLLEPDQSFASPDKVAKSSLEVEYLARAVLGLALISSHSGQLKKALEWLELLEANDAFESVRNQVPTWRLAIQLEQGNYELAREMIEKLVRQENDLTFSTVGDPVASHVAWLRMAAVAGLSSQPQTETSRQFARWAVTELAAQEQMQSVLELARRFGSAAMGKSGFAIEYVNAVMAYYDLRKRHGSEEPTEDPELLSLYATVADQFQAALESSDRLNYSEAIIDGERLLAWSEYFQGHWERAATLFEKVSNQQRPPASADAHWMTIVCFDLLRKETPGQVDTEHLGGLVESFLQMYPMDERAGQLILHQALNQTAASQQAVDRLLNISYESDVYDQAQQRAAQMLYQLFRDSEGSEQLEFAAQYLSIALPLITEDAQRVSVISKLDVDRLIARCRRVLDVSLTKGVLRMSAARQALGILDIEAIAEHLDSSEIANELAYLRLKERLFSDDIDSARKLAQQLYEKQPEGLWSRQAARLIFQKAVARRNESTDNRDIDYDVMKYGVRILDEYANESEALKRPSVRQYTIEVARSALKVWERSQDPEAGELARELFGSLLEAFPKDRLFLRASAVLSQSQGDWMTAMAAWRRLLNGLPMDSDGWYEAKYQQIRILAEHDPEAAQDVMRQFKVLHLDMGPEPWGDLMRELDADLQITNQSISGGAL